VNVWHTPLILLAAAPRALHPHIFGYLFLGPVPAHPQKFIVGGKYHIRHFDYINVKDIDYLLIKYRTF